MREAIARWAAEFPRQPGWRDGTFAGSPVAHFVTHDLPPALLHAMPSLSSKYVVEASAGQGDWTHTPWLAVLDPAVTTSVEDGYYVVYLLSHGCERLYLTLNQGCTVLRKQMKDSGARRELVHRAELMRARVERRASRLRVITPRLNVSDSGWRGKLYEVGTVLGVEYDAQSLPEEAELLADLSEAIDLYAAVNVTGGWYADDDIVKLTDDEGFSGTLIQRKLYRYHRAIERSSSHAKQVKKALGTRCMACDVELRERYGPTADGLIEAHHLLPLNKLEDGTTARLNPREHFAVLCPNCHRVIHRLEDTSDVEALRRLMLSSQR